MTRIEKGGQEKWKLADDVDVCKPLGLSVSFQKE